MKKYPEKNKVGLFRKLRAKDWLINHYAGGKPYLDGKTISYSTVEKPIYSYGHNYEKFGNEFSLFLWTDENDIAKITKHFEYVVNQLKEEDFKMDVEDRYIYLDFPYGGDK